jgi:hypothetical protein
MAGYSELAGSLGKLLRLLADAIEKGQKHGREAAFQEQWSSIEDDPIGWLTSHFSVSKPMPTDSGQTGKTKPKPRSISFNKADAERLAKYILQLEWRY